MDHERLDVYKLAIRFLALAFALLRKLPRGEMEIRQQLKRAAISIPLNIAEGVGKPSVPDRARYHAIARGSAMECAALLDVLELATFASTDEVKEGKALLTRIVAMLTRMCR